MTAILLAINVKIAKTEPLVENIYFDLDEGGKPVRVTFFGKEVNISD